MERVFVTGLGVVSPAGLSTDRFWESLLTARDCFTVFPDHLPSMKKPCTGGLVSDEMFSQISAALPDDVQPAVGEDRNRVFLAYCVLKAIDDAGIPSKSEELRVAPLIFANLEPSFLGIPTNERNFAVRSFESSQDIARSAAEAVGCNRSVVAVHNTCASGNAALEFAVNILRSGMATTAIVCGSDAVSRRIFAGFDTLGAIGVERCRPFSINRKNITIAEGAAAMVIQLEQAVATPSEVYAEVVAVESNNDASHPTNPSLDGIRQCHLRILQNAAVRKVPEVVFAHGTGSPANDAVEASIFLDHYPDAYISAIKGTIGHTMGCAALMGAIASCLTIRHRMVPPNAIERDELEYPLNNFPTKPQPLPHGEPLLIQSNSFGFGGSNSIAVFGAPEHG